MKLVLDKGMTSVAKSAVNNFVLQIKVTKTVIWSLTQ